MGDQFQFVDNNQDVRIAGSLVDQGATVDDVLTVQADGSIAAATPGSSLPSQWTVDPNGAAVFAPDDPGMTHAETPLTLDAPEDTPVLILSNAETSGDASVALRVDLNDGSSSNVLFADGTMNLYPKVMATRPTLIAGDTNGDTQLEVGSDGTIGFFGASAVAQPVVPLTVPTTQDVIDALVALGLVSQSD
jgi:prepilin-type processing-associated H-X9-DG protein